jgi:hypothetical protein
LYSIQSYSFTKKSALNFGNQELAAFRMSVALPNKKLSMQKPRAGILQTENIKEKQVSVFLRASRLACA